MNAEEFWALIGESKVGGYNTDQRSRRLIALLEWLPEQDIVEFQALKDRFVRQADTVGVLAAHHVITGGYGGGDSYFYFLHWLIGLGRHVYERILADPDSLIDVADLPRELGDCSRWSDDQRPDWEYLIGIAAEAHATVAGYTLDGNIDVRDITHSLQDPDTRGERWDMNDPRELTRRLPRLYQAALPNLCGGWPRQS